MLYPRVSLYALMLAAAGIPLYIHLPRFAAVNLGIGLGTIGTVLLVIRLVDLVQDPLIGWAIDRWPGGQSIFAAGAAIGLAIGFPLLFNLPENTRISVLIIILVLLFSAYSLGTILLYGRSATLAKKADAQELMTLAAYREGGQLSGVVIAAAAPALFVALGAGAQGVPRVRPVSGWSGHPYPDRDDADLATHAHHRARSVPLPGWVRPGRCACWPWRWSTACLSPSPRPCFCFLLKTSCSCPIWLARC